MKTKLAFNIPTHYTIVSFKNANLVFKSFNRSLNMVFNCRSTVLYEKVANFADY